MELRFDEQAHEYWYGDKRLPSVTTVLQLEGFSPSHEWIDPWFLERGTHIHKATELYDRGVLDESSIDPRIRGFVDSWEKSERPSWAAIELRLCDPVYGYAGTIDRISVDGDLCDIKSGTPQPWHKIQLASYHGLCKANNLPVKRAYCIYLQEDGSPGKIGKIYLLPELIDAYQTFLCALRVHNAKKEMGIC